MGIRWIALRRIGRMAPGGQQRREPFLMEFDMWHVGQKVRVKTLEQLNKIHQKPSRSANFLAGQVGTIERVEGSYVVLNIERAARVIGITHSGGIWFREIEPIEEPIVLSLWNLTLKQGHTYEIKCSEEAIKELCEFVGDDELATIEGPLFQGKQND